MQYQPSLSSGILSFATRLILLVVVCGTTAAFASTTDHGKLEELDREFKSGPEVTKACLSCHTEAAKQLHDTKHWKWEFLNPDNQQK